jgi:hypothetical protein
MHQIVNAAPTAGEGARLRRYLSAMVSRGWPGTWPPAAAGGALARWAPGRAGPTGEHRRESAQFVDPAEIPTAPMSPGSARAWPGDGTGTWAS